MPLYKRKDVWWIDLRHRGRRVRRSTGTADKVSAKRQHDELQAKLWHEKQAGRQLSDALLAWTAEKPRGRRDLSNVALIRAEYSDRPLIDVSPASVEEALGHRGPGAYNRLMVIVRAALNIAQRKGWIEIAPQFKRRPEPLPPTNHLRAEEWARLRAELPPHLRDMAEFAVATGLRWSNVALLEWIDVSLENRLAWVAAGDAKGRKAIPVPLSDPALALLRRLPRDGPWVFTYKGLPIESPKTAWRKAVARAGLPGLRFHDLRHTWASWHAEAGTPLDVLQRLGGWSSQEMVQRYAHLAPSYVAQFANNVATKMDTRRSKKQLSPR